MADLPRAPLYQTLPFGARFALWMGVALAILGLLGSVRGLRTGAIAAALSVPGLVLAGALLERRDPGLRGIPWSPRRIAAAAALMAAGLAVVAGAAYVNFALLPPMDDRTPSQDGAGAASAFALLPALMLVLGGWLLTSRRKPALASWAAANGFRTDLPLLAPPAEVGELLRPEDILSREGPAGLVQVGWAEAGFRATERRLTVLVLPARGPLPRRANGWRWKATGGWHVGVRRGRLRLCEVDRIAAWLARNGHPPARARPPGAAAPAAGVGHGPVA